MLAIIAKECTTEVKMPPLEPLKAPLALLGDLVGLTFVQTENTKEKGNTCKLSKLGKLSGTQQYPSWDHV